MALMTAAGKRVSFYSLPYCMAAARGQGRRGGACISVYMQRVTGRISRRATLRLTFAGGMLRSKAAIAECRAEGRTLLGLISVWFSLLECPLSLALPALKARCSTFLRDSAYA